MGIERDVLRDEAKRAYKEQVKSVAKRNRIPFSKFYKEYKKLKANQLNDDNKPVDDFNFEQMVNLNDTVELDETKDK